MTDDEKEEMIKKNPRPDSEAAEEPKDTTSEIVDDEEYSGNIWMRGLFMLILAFLFGVAEMILVVFAVLQFLWMLFSKERNAFLSDTGETIGRWLHAVSRFQTGATDDKPFPWRKLD